MNWSSALMAVLYAAAGLFLLVTGTGRDGFPMGLMGLGFLALAAVQVWLNVRKTGPDKTRYTLLMGPSYALFAAGWLYQGCTSGDGLHVCFGLAWIVLAAIWTIRTFRTLRADRLDS